MKIIGIEMVPITLVFKHITTEVFGSLGVKEDKIILKVYTDEGITGLGEISTGMPIFYGETQDTVVSAICDLIFPHVLLNADPFNVDKIVDQMDTTVWGHYLTKSAIDCALFDIMGKSLNVPVYKLLGGLVKSKIPLRRVIGIESLSKMARSAASAMQAGYKGIKIKGGINPQRDIETLKEIRKAIGPGTKICVDVNAAYNIKTASHLIHMMEDYAPVEAEQPLPLFDFEGMAELRKAVRVPIGACEMAFTIYDITRVINMKGADFFNFMIYRSGGFYRGKQIISAINTAGLYCVSADPLGFGIQLAANAHFDASVTRLERPSGYGAGILDFAGQLDTKNLDCDIVLNTPKIENGILEVPEGPGLGVELNEKTVQRYLTPGKAAKSIGKKGR